MRGKVKADSGEPLADRITPACAGKSWLPLPPSAGGGDHPRVCGEKSFPVSLMDESARITPACAGKRPWVSVSGCAGEDHPRVCGEKMILSTV